MMEAVVWPQLITLAATGLVFFSYTPPLRQQDGGYA